MGARDDPNIALLLLAVEYLGELADEMVFLGGAIAGLLITDAAAPDIRPTDDIDAIVSVTTLSDYYALSDRLRKKGFTEDKSAGAPTCRWICGKVTLDVMPVDESVLGFGNRWFKAALEKAQTARLTGGTEIKIATAPHFLITKLEAFFGRGKEDYLLSHDIEDFIAVVDGRDAIIEEVRHADNELKTALSKHIARLIADMNFVAAVSGHLPADPASQARVGIVLERLSVMAQPTIQ